MNKMFSLLGISIITSTLASTSISANHSHHTDGHPPFDNNVYINPWLAETDPRYPTTSESVELLSQTNADALVQINVTSEQISTSVRPDFALTNIFANWSFLNNSHFYYAAVDGASSSFNALATSYLAPYASSAQIVTTDPVKFAQTFINSIDFLYLNTSGYENEDPSHFQRTLLKVVTVVHSKLNKESGIILIGHLPKHGHHCPALDYLHDHGWKIVKHNYQFILRHSDH